MLAGGNQKGIQNAGCRVYLGSAACTFLMLGRAALHMCAYFILWSGFIVCRHPRKGAVDQIFNLEK